MSDAPALATLIGNMPVAEMIFGRQIAPTPRPALACVLALVIDALPMIDDDLTADLVEHLAFMLIERHEDMQAMREVLSVSLTHAQALHVEVLRLRRRLAELHDNRRAGRTAA